MLPPYLQAVQNTNLAAEVYVALGRDDLSHAVFAAMNVMKVNNFMPFHKRLIKSEQSSVAIRTQGNTAYSAGRYREAFNLYNKALLFAPVGSKAIKIAYANRSALLHKINAVEAALVDITICEKMGVPEEIRAKLSKRRHDITIYIDHCKMMYGPSCFSDREPDFGFFTFDVRRNPQIPCASIDVGVIVEKGLPTLAATRDVKVGTVLSVEEAFVSQPNKLHFIICCNYCHRMSFNLIPCENCAFALFCDKECKERSAVEHGAICSMVEVLESQYASALSIIAAKAAIKIWNVHPNKEDFYEASKVLGDERMMKSSINDIFDVNRPLSLLSFRRIKQFPMGDAFAAAFRTAELLHFMNQLTDILPNQRAEKEKAMQAFARIMMFLQIFGIVTKIKTGYRLAIEGLPAGYNISDGGFFPFTGKIRNDCRANCIAVTLHKRTALINIKPIKKGEPLTLSYAGHWFDGPFDRACRSQAMFVAYGIRCQCFVCSGEFLNNPPQPSVEQKLALAKVMSEEIASRANTRTFIAHYYKLCRILASLHNVEFSQAYHDAYVAFREYLFKFQISNAKNEVMEDQPLRGPEQWYDLRHQTRN